MGTNSNLLEDLRKQNGCTLSQEQIGRRMGLAPDANDRCDHKVNKFETGETKNWGVLNVFRYSHVTGLDPRLVFATRYPDEPYSKLFLKTQEKEQNMTETNTNFKMEDTPGTAETSKNAIPSLAGENALIDRLGRSACLLSVPRYGIKSLYLTPEITSAIKEGRNIFAVLENEQDVEKIRTKAKRNGYEVYIADPPHSNINWLWSTREPEAISMFAQSLAMTAFSDKADIFWARAFKDLLEKLCKEYFWNWDVEHDENKYSLAGLAQYISQRTAEDLLKTAGSEYTEKMAGEIVITILNALAPLSLDRGSSEGKLQDIFGQKHIIIYIARLPFASAQATFALEQYLRILHNVKHYSPEHRDTRGYAIVIESLANVTNIRSELLIDALDDSEQMDLRFTYSIASIEQIRDRYNATWRSVLEHTSSLYITGFGQSWFSVGTEEYILEKISQRTYEAYKKKTENVAKETAGFVLCLKDGGYNGPMLIPIEKEN